MTMGYWLLGLSISGCRAASIHLLSHPRPASPLARCLSNWSAGVEKGRKRRRAEENSGVQHKDRAIEECGKVAPSKRCGDSPARIPIGVVDKYSRLK